MPLEEYALFSDRLSNFPEGDLFQAVLTSSDLNGGIFPGADMTEAILIGATAWGADLHGSALAGIKAEGGVFFDADLRGADLRGANLQCADLSGAQLQGSDLRGAMLQGAIFDHANMQAADLRGAMVFGTKFKKTDLTLADTRGLTFSDPSVDEGVLKEPYTSHASYLFEHASRRIKSCLNTRDKALLLDEALHSDSMFDRDGPFKPWGDQIPSRKYEDKVASLLVSLACNDRHIAKALLWAQDDNDWMSHQTLQPRAKILHSDPILLRKAAALIRGLEAQQCQVLEKLPTTNLHQLKTFLKQRGYLTH